MGAFDAQRWSVFCQSAVAAGARRCDLEGQLCSEVWHDVAKAGYLRLFHEEVAGAELYDAMLGLAQACASTFWAATISAALCGRMIVELGSANARSVWQQRLAGGEALGTNTGVRIRLLLILVDFPVEFFHQEVTG